MLILQRKPGQSLRIGENVNISVLGVENGRVRLAIDAPTEIPILRSELIETIAANQESQMPNAPAGELLDLLGSVLQYEHQQHHGKD